MNKVQYCIKCKNDVEYAVKAEPMEVAINGVKVLFIGKAAYCSNCGASLFVDDVVDFNIKAAQKAYIGACGNEFEKLSN
jgi:hypothetical protein